ncbi:hypothetical protein CMO96_01875, partial [Candidatus Woesebacteria bacterium]|nr:hypothetical protein [Candidatus Woesebacteria bacterium]
WSLVSIPINPPPAYDTAEEVLQAAQIAGIDLQTIARWDSQKYDYQVHPLGALSDNFQIKKGEAYWIRNNGPARPLNIPGLPSPSPNPSPSIPPPPPPPGN